VFKKPVRRLQGDENLFRNAPLARGNILSHNEANVSMAGNNQTRVRHEEYIADIASTPTGVFQVQQFFINPGLSIMFPWLSRMASNYEKFRFIKLIFEYRAKCSTASNGTVISMIDYDCSDNPPATKSIMLGQNSVDSNVWLSHEFKANPFNLHDVIPDRYIRNDLLPQNVDQKMYDVGAYYIATQGNTDGSTAGGELFVVYDVLLITPQLSNSNSGSSGASAIGGGVLNPNLMLGTIPVVTSINPQITVGTLISHSAVFVANIGSYILSIIATGTGLTNASVGILTGSGIAVPGPFSLVNAGGTAATATYLLQCTGSTLNNSIVLNPTASGTTVTSYSFRIAPYSTALG